MRPASGGAGQWFAPTVVLDSGLSVAPAVQQSRGQVVLVLCLQHIDEVRALPRSKKPGWRQLMVVHSWLAAPTGPFSVWSGTSLLQTLAAQTPSGVLGKTFVSKGATMETCPSGQLLDLNWSDQRATHGGVSRRFRVDYLARSSRPGSMSSRLVGASHCRDSRGFVPRGD